MSFNRFRRTGKVNIRLLVLLILLFGVGAAFLYDKYFLLPGAQSKIEKVANEVTLSLNDGNRKQVEEIVGMLPSNEFKHRGMDVVQYRFARGLPFYPRPILDVAFKKGAIVRVSTSELTPEVLNTLEPVNKVLEGHKDDRESVYAIGSGGARGPRKKSNSGEEDTNSDKDDSHKTVETREN